MVGPGEEGRVPGRGSKERISNKENVKRGKVEFYMAVHTMRVNTKVKSYVLWLCIPRLGPTHLHAIPQHMQHACVPVHYKIALIPKGPILFFHSLCLSKSGGSLWCSSASV